MSLPALVQHSLLESQGGAARVAGDLCQGLADLGRACSRTFELAEGARQPTGHEQLLAQVRGGALPHLHASANWAALLTALAAPGLAAQGRAVLTLHDCRLFTGGCPFPLDCGHLAGGCQEPCPRGLPGAHAVRAATAAALAQLRPRLVAPSRWMKTLAERCLPGHVVRVIPNGVPFPDSLDALPHKAEARKSFGIDPSATVALLAAHGAEAAQYKGGHLWAGLREKVRSRLPGVLWVVAGGESLAVEEGLLRLPYLPREQLSLLMRAADLFVYPSLADNHPLVLLEAMAAALPALTFPVGGIPEQLTDQATGFFAPCGDMRAMAERAAALLAAPGRLARTGQEAFRHGQARFGLARMVRDHAAFYVQPDGAHDAAGSWRIH